MRLGVLDVGSNTVHLLVVDAHRGAHPTPMHDQRSVLRLAEHVGSDGLLSKAGEKALLRAVQNACVQAEAQRCDAFLGLVTSAIREADNGLEVLDRIRARTGVDLQVLSGEDETRPFRTLARLTGAAPYAAVPRELRLESLEQLLGFISRLESGALAELQGVSPDRAHQVPAGAVVARAAMRALAVPCVRICPWALREGVILRRLDSLGGA